MYAVAVRRTFIARHFLIGGDWGAESLPNSHQYVFELQLESPQVDEHGYVCDIDQIQLHMGQLVARYREAMLNDLPEFEGINPSLENFAQILARELGKRIRLDSISSLRVVLWENPEAWASFTISR